MSLHVVTSSLHVVTCRYILVTCRYIDGVLCLSMLLHTPLILDKKKATPKGGINSKTPGLNRGSMGRGRREPGPDDRKGGRVILFSF
jgi:hypothetical protein